MQRTVSTTSILGTAGNYLLVLTNKGLGWSEPWMNSLPNTAVQWLLWLSGTCVKSLMWLMLSCKSPQSSLKSLMLSLKSLQLAFKFHSIALPQSEFFLPPKIYCEYHLHNLYKSAATSQCLEFSLVTHSLWLTLCSYSITHHSSSLFDALRTKA